MKNLMLLLLLFILPFTSMNAFEVDGITYQVVGDGSVGVTRGGYSGDVVIPSSVLYEGQEYAVTEILTEAFVPCYDLTSVVIPSSVTKIGEYAFQRCTGLTSVTIPGGVIGDYAFERCTSLTSVTIPGGVIGEGAFFGCTALTSVILGPGVTEIGMDAFMGCRNLLEIHSLNENEVPAGNPYFSNSDNLTLYIPMHLKEAYQEAWGIKNIVATAVIDGVTYQDTGEGTVHVVRNENHAAVGDVVIPELLSYKGKEYTVTAIESRAFEDCTELVSVSIPKTVTQIGTNLSYNSFKGCSKLMAIQVAEENEAYKSVDGVLYDKEMSFLLQYPAGRQGAFTVPEGVTYIEGESFYGCTGLTSIKLPETTQFIGSETFYGCTGLTSVTLPDSVHSLWYGSFSRCI